MSSKQMGYKLLFILIGYSIFIMLIIALLACLGSALLVYYERGVFLFDFRNDFIYSLKAGLAAGIPAGIGIWILSKMQSKKKNI